MLCCACCAAPAASPTCDVVGVEGEGGKLGEGSKRAPRLRDGSAHAVVGQPAAAEGGGRRGSSYASAAQRSAAQCSVQNADSGWQEVGEVNRHMLPTCSSCLLVSPSHCLRASLSLPPSLLPRYAAPPAPHMTLSSRMDVSSTPQRCGTVPLLQARQRDRGRSGVELLLLPLLRLLLRGIKRPAAKQRACKTAAYAGHSAN